MANHKIKLNTEWLSVCGGCHVSIVDMHEKILSVLDAVEIQRCPLLTDIKDYPKADVGIITGAVRNTHDREAAEEMRAACDKILAFGTCAVYGGLPGAALAHSREEILEEVYKRSRTTETNLIPNQRISALEKMITPVDEVIDVDLYLPGCPPHASFVFDSLLALVEGRSPKANKEAVCGRCKREMVHTNREAIKASHDGIPDASQCFLSQGYVCLGSVTLDRCLAPCPNSGVACTGCAGPTLHILTEPNRDIRTEVAERMASLTQISRQDIVAKLERDAKTHYAYAMATDMIGSKPTFLIKKWIAAIEEAR